VPTSCVAAPKLPPCSTRGVGGSSASASGWGVVARGVGASDIRISGAVGVSVGNDSAVAYDATELARDSERTPETGVVGMRKEIGAAV